MITPIQVSDFISQNYQIKLQGRTKLIIDNLTLSGSLARLFDEQSHNFFNSDIKDIFGLDATSRKTLLERSFNMLLQKQIEQGDSDFKIDADIENSFSMSGYLPAIDLKSGSLLVLNQDFSLTGIHPDAIKNKLSTKEFNAWRKQAQLLSCIYNPQSLETVASKDNHPTFKQPYIEVNVCNHADWRKRPLVQKDLPKMLATHFSYFIPDADCRHFFFCWLRTAIFDRNGTALVLIGTKGAGKGLLNKLMRKMVGPQNYGEAPRSFFQKEFNKVLKYKMLINVDELTAGKKGIEIMKSYLNDQQNIEEKGKDADQLIDMHASFIISNNNETSFKLQQDDRRFSVMDLTKVPMLEAFGKEYVDNINREIDENDELIYEFGCFLYHYDIKGFNKYDPWKGDQYHSVVICNFNYWQQQLYKKLTSREQAEYFYEDLFPKELKHLSKMTPRSEKFVENFIMNHRYEGEPIATFEHRTENGKYELYLIPCKALQPIQEEVE